MAGQHIQDGVACHFIIKRQLRESFIGEFDTMKSGIIRFIVFLSLLWSLGCATTQDVSRVDSRIFYLERQNAEAEKAREQFQLRMEDFRKNQLEKEQNIRSQYAELYVALDRLQEQIQMLGGKIEERDHQLRQKIQVGSVSAENLEPKINALEQASVSVRDRLQRIEEYLAFEVPPKKPFSGKETLEKTPARDKPDALPEMSENDLYAKAKQDFDNGNLEQARTGFSEFMKRFPKSSIADSAQFWLGEIFYRQKWYEKAILEYQKVIETYPKGNKIQAALLKQGFSFLNLGDKANANLILKELIKKYPTSNEAKIAKQKLEGS